MDRVLPRLEELLSEAPRWTGGKQWLTAARLHELLVAEGRAVSDRVVCELVAEWKRRRQEIFVPHVCKLGELAEVDFFEVLVDIAGERRKAWMFVMRLIYSGCDFAWLYPRQDQVCFLDGHVRAFEHFGAVPHRAQLLKGHRLPGWLLCQRKLCGLPGHLPTTLLLSKDEAPDWVYPFDGSRR